MPYTKSNAKYKHGHPNLVGRLVTELGNPQPQGTVGAPDIIEQQQPQTGRFHVYVIWDDWTQVSDPVERSAIILDAYEKQFGVQKTVNIVIAMGVTPQEAKNLGITK